MSNILSVLFFMIFCCVGKVAMAQTPLTKDTENKNRFYLKTGIEPTTKISGIYEHKTQINILENDLVLFIETSFFNFKTSLEDSEVKIGGILPYQISGNIMLVNNFNTSIGAVSTRHFNSKKIAFANELNIGVYKKKWFIGLTVEYEKIVLTHLNHTEFYRKTYYEDAVDGWYKGAGSMIQIGLEGAVVLKDQFELLIELKHPWTGIFTNYYGSPIHANLGIGYCF